MIAMNHGNNTAPHDPIYTVCVIIAIKLHTNVLFLLEVHCTDVARYIQHKTPLPEETWPQVPCVALAIVITAIAGETSSRTMQWV